MFLSKILIKNSHFFFRAATTVWPKSPGDKIEYFLAESPKITQSPNTLVIFKMSLFYHPGDHRVIITHHPVIW